MTAPRPARSFIAGCTVALLAVAGSSAADGRPYTRNVAVVVYDGMEILDFGGPAEVFAAAAGFGAQGSEPAYRVYTVGRSVKAVVSQGFIDIVPDYTIENSPLPDILILPGGQASAVSDDPEFFAWIGKAGAASEALITVCTGAFIAAKAGFLDGLEATTYYGALPNFTTQFPKVRVQPGRRFVDNGRVVTTAGVSAGIDGSLHFVARDLGRWVADRTAEYMEYRWSPESTHASRYAQLNPRLDDRGRELQLAGIALRSGDVEQALAEYRRLLAGAPGDAAIWLGLGNALAQERRYPQAIEALERAARGEAERGRALYNLACVLALTGERERAFAALEGAVAAGFAERSVYLGDPDFASIRDDPRFREIVARLAG